MGTRLAILGAGAWGTALAISAARHHPEVLLWARDAAQVADMQAARCNTRYLPDAPFPEALRLTHDLQEAVAHARGPDGLIIIGTPMAALGSMLQSLPDDAAALWLCKGFEKGSGRLGHEIAEALRPNARNGVLSGPSFAHEVALGQPTALVAASSDTAAG
jgi:glycerol-3-phosphate dehydrogenase (NAD(P)+)